MRVLHLTTSTRGGAGLAATRLSEEMKVAGVKSTLYSRENWKELHASTFNNRVLTLLTKVVTLISQRNSVKRFTMVTPVSIGILDRKVITRLNPDVIHIHNWYNFLSPIDIAWIVGSYPTVFTLHDQRLMSGGCHYTYDCSRFTQSCKSCPAIHFGKSTVSLTKLGLDKIFINNKGKYAIIGPSKWILSQALEAPLGKNAMEIDLIPNVMEPSLFNLELEPRDFMFQPIKLLFIAADCAAHSKGLDILLDALPVDGKIKNSNIDYELNVIGDFSGIRRTTNPNVNYLGKKSPSEIQELLLSHEILLVPSRYDNSPSVISEGQLACIAVLASRVGGNPELLNMDQEFLFELNPTDINSKILNIIGKTDLRDALRINRQVAMQRNNPVEVVNQHISLYKKLISNDTN